MRNPVRSVFAAGLVLVAAALVAIGCGSSDDNSSSSGGGGGGGTIALLLPENQTPRYEAADRPFFEKKVKELCADCKVLYSNAEGDINDQQSQAESALTQGADVLERATDGDLGCRRAVGDAGRYIGSALADLCNLVNPDRIVVGGSLGASGDVLLDPMRESLRHRAIPSAGEDVEIVQSELGDRAELLGTVALVLYEGRPTAASAPSPSPAPKLPVN